MLLNISKKTKIVCTIGPASDTKEMILRLYKAGMNVMRINFSHGEYSEQGAKIKIRNELEEEGIYIPWALDTKGPEIRCHKMENGKVAFLKVPLIFEKSIPTPIAKAAFIIVARPDAEGSCVIFCEIYRLMFVL